MEHAKAGLDKVLSSLQSAVMEEPKEGEQIKMIPLQYICQICGEVSFDDEMLMKEDSNPRIIECDNCRDKREYSERLEKYFQLIPKRYRVKMEYTGPEQLKTAECSLVYGNYGTGKTWNSYSLCQSLYMEKYIHSFKIVREADIVHSFREGKYSEYNHLDLLIIDEFTKAADTEFVRSEIFNLIDYRYDEMKKTILICNAKDKEQLKQMVDYAILDRYRASVHLFDGKSRR